MKKQVVIALLAFTFVSTVFAQPPHTFSCPQEFKCSNSSNPDTCDFNHDIWKFFQGKITANTPAYFQNATVRDQNIFCVYAQLTPTRQTYLQYVGYFPLKPADNPGNKWKNSNICSSTQASDCSFVEVVN